MNIKNGKQKKIKVIKNPLKNRVEAKNVNRGSNYYDAMRYSRLADRQIFNFRVYRGLGYKICLKRK
jgi:hypothetical protein